MSKILNMKELDIEDDDYLNRLCYIKKSIQEELDRQMSMYFKIMEMNALYQKTYNTDFDNGCSLEIDMERNQRIIEKVDTIISDILLDKASIIPFDSHDYNLESYAEFILKNDYNISTK